MYTDSPTLKSGTCGAQQGRGVVGSRYEARSVACSHVVTAAGVGPCRAALTLFMISACLAWKVLFAFTHRRSSSACRRGPGRAPGVKVGLQKGAGASGEGPPSGKLCTPALHATARRQGGVGPVPRRPTRVMCHPPAGRAVVLGWPLPHTEGAACLQERHQRRARLVVGCLDGPPLPVGLAHLVEAKGHDGGAHCRVDRGPWASREGQPKGQTAATVEAKGAGNCQQRAVTAAVRRGTVGQVESPCARSAAAELPSLPLAGQRPPEKGAPVAGHATSTA